MMTRSNTTATGFSTSSVIGSATASPMPVQVPATTTVVVAQTSETSGVDDTATGRSTLETMHELLTTSLLPLDTGEGGGGGDSAPSCPREARGAETKSEEAETPPSLWVTRYVDKSTKYGLGFLLSNESVGVRFNDGTAIVLEPAGTVFDYIQRARTRRSPRAKKVRGGGACSGGGGGGGHEKQYYPARARHTLGDFPPCLEKKVHLLHRFRRHLQEFDDTDADMDSSASSRVASRATATTMEKEEAAPSEGGTGSAQQQGHAAAEEETCLTFVEKWRCTRKDCLFVLSDGTVQVRDKRDFFCVCS